MEIAAVEDMADIPAGTGYASIAQGGGPGTFVWFVSGDLIAGETLTVTVEVTGVSHGGTFTTEALSAAVNADTNRAGVQSAPVPLVDGDWNAQVRVLHDGAANRNLYVTCLKL